MTDGGFASHISSYGFLKTRMFDGLIVAGKRMLAPRTADSFFEKFGSGRSESVRQACGHYMTGLGLLGKRQKAEAKKEFESAVQLDYSLLGARTMAAGMK